MRTLRLAAAALLSLPASSALAETRTTSPIEEYVPPVAGWMTAERPNGVQTVRQVLEPVGPPRAVGETLILYINKNGTTLTPGTNDSRTNRSTLVNQTRAIPAWNVSATAWQQIMDCTRTMWAPFNVLVTDVDPGNVPHMESIVTTVPGTIGMDPNVGGVSPYLIGCGAIDNSIVFTFADAFGGDPETICEVMGQEMAHSIGLDHEMLASDPMTYLQYNGLQSFKDQAVSCGEYQNRACGLQGECGASQNSYQMLMQRVGPAGGGGGAIPEIAITSPANGATVRPGFSVTADATDDGTIARVELWLDGALVDTKTVGPFTFTTSGALTAGVHTVQTVVYDNDDQSSIAQIEVTVSPDAPPDPDGDGTPDVDGDGDGTQDPAQIVGGCAAGGGSSGAGLVLLGLAAVGLARRRRS